MNPEAYLWYPEDRNLLLLKVSPVLLVNENKIQVVAYAELLVHFTEGWCEVEAAEEETNGYGFSCNGVRLHL